MLVGKMQRAILMAIFLFASLSVAEDVNPGGGTTNEAKSTTTNSGSGGDAKPNGSGGDTKPTGSGGDTKRIFDFKLTDDMKTADLDNPSSALSKLIAFIVKGAGKASEYVSILHPRKSPSEIQLEIRDDSIFIPGGNSANAQHGFRRTDVNPAIDKTTTLTGITTWYQTIRLDSKAPLVLTHGYLFASIEVPSGDHIFDIFGGSDFDAQNTDHKPSSNSETIRVRDFKTKTLLSLPLKYDQNYNFAVTVDWDANTLTVYSSIGAEPLKMAGGPMPNDAKAMSPEFKQKGEYHIQLIKFPLADSKDPVDKRSDTPHFGFQEPIKKEHVFFSNVFATSGKEIEQPKFSVSKKGKKPKACKRS
ncbi:hypothetical protein PGT21_020753 [Puccinia graminis f. sp. tritici]|uniref:Glycoside hydrolase 131 catalytic N-terminal domain-containing protein n=2 Tax=Puccinia graminis f. sp. tritici TaxID=56615 RepID=E3KDR3_PUCGT|nr:uncharacterized protein PGTG_08455 [Puccinia graminis f. sp. tritici CRL 75-36-700-3]EFP82499.1 hypothetical protein PGTG_08455 [Puccinia graminis f. sp. tritici CRL 75-36-700-3]KAA1082933.1 hypothetical protein PGT21_020753 [Puccinia graminis f. sp. tritici]KAA1124134.1 hypothetical protein PGTUg99_029236 [Puccinia graminis f. sp. tritici]